MSSLFFFCCSPSICHSDSDLSDGSRKYSPSSETSLETQRACGKAQTCCTHSYFKKKNVWSILYKAISHKSWLTENGRLFTIIHRIYITWTNNSLPPLLLFSSVPLPKEAAALMYVFLFFVSCFVYSSRLHLSGGFSETYSALCDYNGISCKEEVQWVRALGLCHCECFWGLHTE